MTEEAIKVYARVRPCPDPSNDYDGLTIDELDPDKLRIDFESSTSTNIESNQHFFKFDHIFWKDSLQEDIFQIIALPLIDHTLEGYNSTLFAYGQTGSGKTFTITGDGTPSCMGIVPRALSYVYDKIQNSPKDYSISISYLEIYNNNAYDLLTRINSNQLMRLEDLTKVTIAENGTETFFKDLSIEPAPTIDEAHRLFWIGECSREKAATVNNKYSSRSHTIFTMYFKTSDGLSFINSRINFVDLAGSEKYESLNTAIDKRKLEARHINKSLHTLQNVIIGLNQKKKHIPFRDSSLTRFLKDSLVGNVKTAMIATISSNKNHIPESLSTCRFSESVAAVTTITRINQTEMTQQEVISKLREEVTKLRSELSQITYANSGNSSNFISQKEKESLQQQVTDFVEDKADELSVFVPPHVQYCFQAMKDMVRNGNSSALRISQLQQYLIDTQRTVNNLVCYIKTPQTKATFKASSSSPNLLASSQGSGLIQSSTSNLLNSPSSVSNANVRMISKEEAYVEFFNSYKNKETLDMMKEKIAKWCIEGKKLNKKAKHITVKKLKKEDKLNKIKEAIKFLTAQLQTSNEYEQNSNTQNNKEGFGFAPSTGLFDEEATRRTIEEAKKSEKSMIQEIELANEDLEQTMADLNRRKQDIMILMKEYKQTIALMQQDFEKFWMSTILKHEKSNSSATVTPADALSYSNAQQAANQKFPSKKKKSSKNQYATARPTSPRKPI